MSRLLDLAYSADMRQEHRAAGNDNALFCTLFICVMIGGTEVLCMQQGNHIAWLEKSLNL
jgi:hypothetical protein